MELKKLIPDFKNPKVRIWFISMAIVIVVSFSIMSVIMLTSQIHYGKKLKAPLYDVSKVVITNAAFTDKGLNNNMIGGTLDTLGNENEAKAVKKILNLLNEAGKTNRFSQFFGGQSNGSEKVIKTSTTDSIFKSNAGGTYIKIIFATPTYVLTQINNSAEYKVEKYNVPSLPYPPGFTLSDYNNRTVNAIYIPIGKAKDSFDTHTWYLCGLGSTNYDTMTHTFTTYGNYHKLLNYVSELDNTVIF